MNQLLRRRAYFNSYYPQLPGANRRDIKGLGNTCPSCAYPTIDSRNGYEICGICWWEDDGQDDFDADEVFGGPNESYSLTEFRRIWIEKIDQLKALNNSASIALKKIDVIVEEDLKVELGEINEMLKHVVEYFDSLRLKK